MSKKKLETRIRMLQRQYATTCVKLRNLSDEINRLIAKLK